VGVPANGAIATAPLHTVNCPAALVHGAAKATCIKPRRHGASEPGPLVSPAPTGRPAEPVVIKAGVEKSNQILTFHLQSSDLLCYDEDVRHHMVQGRG